MTTTEASLAEIRLTSPAFEYGKPIPKVHTCDGDDVSPALQWSGIPENAKSLALVVADPDPVPVAEGEERVVAEGEEGAAERGEDAEPGDDPLAEERQREVRVVGERVHGRARPPLARK